MQKNAFILHTCKTYNRYAFDGYLYSIFHGQEYTTSYGVISGDVILQSESLPPPPPYPDFIFPEQHGSSTVV